MPSELTYQGNVNGEDVNREKRGFFDSVRDISTRIGTTSNITCILRSISQNNSLRGVEPLSEVK